MSSNRTGMEPIQVSIFASAVRPKIWEAFFQSLNSTTCSFEVVFSGHNTPEEVAPFLEKYPFFKYIHTARIKPSQNYEVSRRACIGETIIWNADDAEMPNDVIGKAYRYWKSQNNEKLILSIQTREFYLDGGDGFCDMTKHAFYGGDSSSPLMAPLGMISRKFFNDLGGFDRRFICGQQENLCVMMAYEQGGKVEIFGDKESYIEIDHIRKSIECNESKNKSDFLDRPFAKGYKHDRRILESACSYKNGEIKILSFEPFTEENLLTKSQSYRGDIWI